MLFYLLDRHYKKILNDFESVSLLVVYPRRFAKTTLMGFIEAVFSPVPMLGKHNMNKVRTKIAALECGKQLLDFGWRPVVCLDLQNISTVQDLKDQIEIKLGRAGLKKADLEMLIASNYSPSKLLYKGVVKLNEDFEETFGIKRDTIVLIDEYDKLFRDRDVDDYQENRDDTQTARGKKETIAALFNIFGIGKEESLEGVSLLVLCGLTRMLGSGLFKMNNLVDVSSLTIYHGLCGISAKEFVECANGQLDDAAQKKYKKTLLEIMEEKFIPDWTGFRFGLTDEVGLLDPESFDGALFSPLDVWEIVRSLLGGEERPSSRWIKTMKSEFEFTKFAATYIPSRDARLLGATGLFELYRNLQGGWVDTLNPSYNMDRSNYLLLSENLHVQKVLFELGLLNVKEFGDKNAITENWVRLGSLNWTLTRNAMRLLVDMTQQVITPEELAREYLDDADNGFGNIVISAAREVSKVYRGTGKDVLREYPFQDYLFTELLFRFPEGLNGFPDCYKLYKEVRVLSKSEVLDLANLSPISINRRAISRSLGLWRDSVQKGEGTLIW
jgi:hypothetical protein